MKLTRIISIPERTDWKFGHDVSYETYPNHFNSRKDRLKDKASITWGSVTASFQFQKGPIESYGPAPTPTRLAHFNSRKDRLKVVRAVPLVARFGFQFQKGPIERFPVMWSFVVVHWFQFQKGPIERRSDFSTAWNPKVFQFQKGPIESCLRSMVRWPPAAFQFQKGPIERRPLKITSTSRQNFNSRKDRLKVKLRDGEAILYR